MVYLYSVFFPLFILCILCISSYVPLMDPVHLMYLVHLFLSSFLSFVAVSIFFFIVPSHLSHMLTVCIAYEIHTNIARSLVYFRLVIVVLITHDMHSSSFVSILRCICLLPRPFLLSFDLSLSSFHIPTFSFRICLLSCSFLLFVLSSIYML